MTHSTRARSMWRRNWWPRPVPSLAPSIRPGMSATTNSVSSSRRTTPRLRLEGGERVVGDLRLGRADDADQRALADVGEADERDVGHQLELELQPPLLAVLALLGERRRPAAVRRELGVAPPAAAAGGGQPAVAVVDEVGEQLAGVQVAWRPCPRARRPRCVSPRLPCWSLPLPWTPSCGAAVRVVAEREQRGDVAVGDQPDVAALAAVAAVRAAHRDGALTAERHAAGAAVATAHVQLGFVDESGS